MSNKNFYITTTLPYVNADPHIGFALEIVQADVIARYHRLTGDNVLFNFGTDEHGLKIYRKALEQKKEPQKYCDEYAVRWDKLKEALNVSYTNFIRTTEPHHLAASQELWKRCVANGDIYKASYPMKYCVGCELEKTDSELVDARCPVHPNLTIETYEEENYFFRFSKYQKPLLDFYDRHPDFVVPEAKFREIRSFVAGGLQDFSVSRLRSKMPWGVEVPDDPDHVMYVWFDALTNYISTLGWPEDRENFDKWWPVMQVAGKDNLRQQTAIWQAMLMSGGLPNSGQVFIHGFIQIEGQKISKSLGNVIDPFELVDIYGTDAVRYYLLSKIHPWEDSDFTLERFKEIYNADLANGIGNLVARVAKLCEMSGLEFPEQNDLRAFDDEVGRSIVSFQFDQAMARLWRQVKDTDRYLDDKKPWKQGGVDLEESLTYLVGRIRQLADDLLPFLPYTAERINKQFMSSKILSSTPIFPRII